MCLQLCSGCRSAQKLVVNLSLSLVGAARCTRHTVGSQTVQGQPAAAAASGVVPYVQVCSHIQAMKAYDLHIFTDHSRCRSIASRLAGPNTSTSLLSVDALATCTVPSTDPSSTHTPTVNLSSYHAACLRSGRVRGAVQQLRCSCCCWRTPRAYSLWCLGMVQCCHAPTEDRSLLLQAHDRPLQLPQGPASQYQRAPTPSMTRIARRTSPMSPARPK